MMYFGGFLMALGLTMWTRGMIYTLRPQGKIAEKRKRKNLKYGFTTDMKLFGRKIRRLGFLLTLFGALGVAWSTSGSAEQDAATVNVPALAAEDSKPPSDPAEKAVPPSAEDVSTQP